MDAMRKGRDRYGAAPFQQRHLRFRFGTLILTLCAAFCTMHHAPCTMHAPMAPCRSVLVIVLVSHPLLQHLHRQTLSVAAAAKVVAYLFSCVGTAARHISGTRSRLSL